MEIRKLNMLRGLAALIVVVSHFSNHTNWLNMNIGAGAGQFGVMLFFILSGFLMAYLYLNRDYTKPNIKQYVIARAARVVPLFVLVVVLSYLLKKYLGVGLYNIVGVDLLISHLLLFKGVSVLWTIGPEIQFYFIFPLIWWLLSRKEANAYTVMAIIFILLFFTGFPVFTGETLHLPYSIHLFRCLPYFFVGVILGRLYSLYKVPDNMQSGWFGYSLLIIILLYPKIFIQLSGFNHQMWTDIGVLVIMTIVFASVIFFVPNDNLFMANRIGDFLGKISYSVYLLHLPVLGQVTKFSIESVEIKFIIFILCTLTLSYYSYKFIELPSSKFIRKITSQRKFPYGNKT